MDLVTNPKYSHLNSDEKLLYILLLNRKKVSQRNANYFSDENGVFVFFPKIQIQKHLNCSDKTAIKILDNLQQEGLIRKEYQKRGLPLKIYVNDVFGMHEKSNVQEKANTYKPKQTFKPHSLANIQNEASFDIGKAEEIARRNRADFGSKKNKRRSVNSTF